MVTADQIREAVPRFLNPTRNWNGLCEAAVWNLFDVLGSGGMSSSTATLARQRSEIEGDDYGPGQNVVWWSGVSARNDPGHVAYHLGGGLAFMASSHVTDRVATNLGFIDLAAYTRATGLTLEGWSYDHAGATIPRNTSTLDLAGDGAVTPLQEGFLMALDNKAQEDLANKVDYIFNAIGGPNPGAYNMVSALDNKVQDIHDALLEEDATSGKFKLTDILSTHVGAILRAVRQLAKDLGKNVDAA